MRYRYYGGGAFFILFWAILLGLWINPFLWFILLLWLPLGGYYGKSVSATPDSQGIRGMRLNF